MVQRTYVKCPSCGKIYQLKFQLDQNIQIYEWPIMEITLLIDMGSKAFSQRNLCTRPRHKIHR